MENSRYKFRAWNGREMRTDFSINSDGTNTANPKWNIMQFTGLKDKNGVEELFEGDIIGLDGKKKGNKYETPSLLKEKSNFIIEGMGTQAWRNSEQEAMERGCFYPK